MKVEPGGNCWTKAEDTVVAALADCTAFRSLAEVSSSQDAAERVYLDVWPAPWNGEARTREQNENQIAAALVTSPDTIPYRFALIEGKPTAAGKLEIKIVKTVRESEPGGTFSSAQVDRRFREKLGTLMTELLHVLQSGKGRNWATSIEVEYGPLHNHRRKRAAGHLLEAKLALDWGHPLLRESL